MNDWLLALIHDPSLTRFAFVLGIVLSLWLYDRFHITSGSVIAPAYIALNLGNPLSMLAMVINTFLVHWMVYRGLMRVLVMSGRQKFLATIPLSIALQLVTTQCLAWALAIPENAAGSEALWQSFGFVIPALLAHDLATQGIRSTLGAVTGLTAVIALAGMGFALFVPQTPGPEMAGIASALAFDPRWLGAAMLLSSLGAIALSSGRGYRTGGFVGAAYVAILLTRPLELLFFGVLALLTYALVVYGLSPRMILFGRRKFAAMMLVASVLSWGATLLKEVLLSSGGLPAGALSVSDSAFVLISLTITGLVANDMERVGVRRLFAGVAVNTLWTFCGTLLLVGLFVSGETRHVLLLFTGVLGAAGFMTLTPARCDRAWQWLGRVYPRWRLGDPRYTTS